jgi:hypothetical protein
MFCGLFCLGRQTPVFASPTEQEFCYSEYDWNELEIGSFVLVFPVEQTSLAQEIFVNLPHDLETMMANYRQVFGVELVLPITIRVYPTFVDYYCLNPLAAPVAGDAVHAHIGQREIALFAYLDEVDAELTAQLIINGLRHELAVLFAEELSGGYAPAGLLMGLGGYAEDPAETFSLRFDAAGNPGTPSFGWQTLWEAENLLSDPGYLLETTSTVAYLIDVHGWGNFIQFLEQINVQQGYRQALVEVYGANTQAIQSHWKAYFPTYVSQRWQANIFHHYDLGIYQELLSAGVYQDSIDRLTEAVMLVAVFGTEEELALAERLLADAEMGAEAGELTMQARNALFSGRYVESYTSAELAMAHYSQLGDDRRMFELQAYMVIAKEVLDLRAGLEVIREQGIGISPFRSQKVFEIGQRLLQLGDSEGVDQAEMILFVLGAGQNTYFQFLISVVVLISTGLIIRRILSHRKEIPPEADLL